MPGLMIIAHAPLASTLKALAEHAFPECAAVLEALDVAVDAPLEETEARARQMLARVRTPEALVFTDVLGATPCNVAQRIADGRQVRVVAGVNVPMLWRSLCYSAEPLDALVLRAVAGAIQGVSEVAAIEPQPRHLKADGNDQSQRPHH